MMHARSINSMEELTQNLFCAASTDIKIMIYTKSLNSNAFHCKIVP